MQNESRIIQARLLQQSQKYSKYKFDLSQNSTISMKDYQQKIIQINLQDWKFFKKGEGHLLFESNLFLEFKSQGIYNKLIKIQIQPQNIESFQYLHQKALKNFSCIQKLVLQSQIYVIQSQNYIETLTNWVNQMKIVKKSFYKIVNFQLIDNLTKFDFNFLVQIKPKTPLPQHFNLKFIQYVFIDKFDEIKQKKLSLLQIEKKNELQQVFQLIQDCSQIEKTRWFKKNCLKQKKKNLNPLTTYGIVQQKIQFLNHCLCNKQAKILTQQQKTKINFKIRHQLMKEPLFEKLVLLHSLCQYPADLIEQFYLTIKQQNQNCLQNLFQNELNQIFNLVQKRIQEVKLQMSKYSSYKQYTKNMLKIPCITQYKNINLNYIEKLAHIFLFLLTLTWKDISLMILIKINKDLEQNFQEQNIQINIKIIDYGIKNISSIKRNVQKDSQYLLYYWVYKNGLKLK